MLRRLERAPEPQVLARAPDEGIAADGPLCGKVPSRGLGARLEGRGARRARGEGAAATAAVGVAAGAEVVPGNIRYLGFYTVFFFRTFEGAEVVPGKGIMRDYLI